MTIDPKQLGAASQQQRERQAQAWSAEETARSQDEPALPGVGYVRAEFAVQAVHNNYLECLHFDGTATYGDLVNVAKDPELRAERYDGKTIDGLGYDYTGPQARTVIKNAGQESEESKDQVIIPKYHVPADGGAGFLGSIITADNSAIKVSGAGWCQWTEITQRAYANVEADA